MTDSPAITEAFDNFTNLKLAVGKASAGLYTTAKLLYEAKLNKYYKDMGCDTLREYAAQSEIGLSSSTASMLITLYDKFVIEADDHEILDVQIMFKDYSKAYKAIPLLANNKPHEVIEIIQGNSTADIITRVKELNGVSMAFPEQVAPIRKTFNSPELAARWTDRVHSQWFKGLAEDDQLLILDTLSYFERNMI